MRPNAWVLMGTSARIDAGGWLSRARSCLVQSDNPGLEARLLLAHVLAQPASSVLAHPEQEINPEQLDRLEDMLKQLCDGVPLAYVLGVQEFYGMQFKVNPAVLIPRPETELLVETALDWLRLHHDHRAAVDVGTGSGCIAAALAFYVQDLLILACDRSRAALTVAKENFVLHGLLDRIRLVQSDLMTCIAGKFDLVCANLPYVPSSTLEMLEVTKHEPALALDGGPSGLLFIRELLEDSRRWTAPGGLLLLEIEAGQAESAPELANRYYGKNQITVMNDLAGRPRLLKIRT